MILLTLAAAIVQSGSAVPSAVPPTAPILRNEFVTRSRSLPYPETMRPMVAEYRHCIYPNGRSPHEAELSLEQAMRNRLVQCTEVRTRQVAKSIVAYPRPQGRQNRSALVEAIFESMDRDYVANAQFMDRVISGEVTLPAPGVPVDLPKDPDAED